MELDMYTKLLVGSLGAVVVAQVYKRQSAPEKTGTSASTTANFTKFRNLWLAVYYIVMGSDWLQGPYVYSLYESLGFQKPDIAILFIAGFGSSMLFGTFIGSIADKFGRKRFAILFGIFYSLSCITKLSNKFYVLLFGRILAGIATSLLYSVFEAWMVAEHLKRGFPQDLISSTFSMACFGNGVVAIVSGLVASHVASTFGFVAPFMVSLCLLILSIVLVFTTWTENYGNSNIDVQETFSSAVNDLRRDIKIPILGLMQSLFEGSMYTFVFMWTPTLNDAAGEGEPETEIPYGVIFACFMVALMIGSTLFEIAVRSFSAEKISIVLYATAACSLLVPALQTDKHIVLISFMVFELCCGIYFPCMGTIRSKYIPERSRSTIMNFFRIGLNLLVVIVLLKVGSLDNQTVFMICTSWLLVGFLLTNVFDAFARKAEAAVLEESQ